MAAAVGVRADNWHTPVPSRIRWVAAPIQASGVRASEPYASAVQTESKPSRSACYTNSTKPVGGDDCQ
jgi:hypothetical protein